MTNKKHSSIAERLLAAQLAIDNALKIPKILDELTAYGYNAERISAGRRLYEEASELVTIQKKEYGEQYEATDDVNSAWETADEAYMNTLKIARIAMRANVSAQNALALNGIRKNSLSGWLEQTDVFYRNLLADPDMIAAMGNFGYNKEKLDAEKVLVDAVADANLIQEKEKGEALDATATRDAKIDEMDKWMADFKQIALIALADNPKWLEKLGF